MQILTRRLTSLQKNKTKLCQTMYFFLLQDRKCLPFCDRVSDSCVSGTGCDAGAKGRDCAGVPILFLSWIPSCIPAGALDVTFHYAALKNTPWVSLGKDIPQSCSPNSNYHESSLKLWLEPWEIRMQICLLKMLYREVYSSRFFINCSPQGKSL